MKVRQYGIERSGTNALRKWLQGALGVDVKATGYDKHTLIKPALFPEGSLEGWKIILSIRDPYSWIGGYARHRRREPKHVTVKEATQWIKHYTYHYERWLAHEDNPYIVVRMEDMLSKPDEVLGRLASFLGVEVVGGTELPPNRMDTSGRETRTPYSGAKYIDGSFMNDLNEETISVVTEIAPWGLLAPYGYEAQV